MADIIRKRLTGKDEGFTLIELLVVIVILGILMAIAVPSYMGFADRANKTAAQANVRAALPAVEAYYQDHNTYAGMTLPVLKTTGDATSGNVPYDTGIKLDALVPADQTDTSFCISDTTGGGKYVYNQTGPAGSILAGKCAGA